MLNYTYGLIRQGTRILLLNREKPAWMGAWNGVGGKIEEGEEPAHGIRREIAEETGIRIADPKFKGIVAWSVDGTRIGGMYAYVAELPEDYKFPTPVKTPEGLLDWKEIDWIAHPLNKGVAYHLPRCLDKLLFDDRLFEYRCLYEQGRLVDMEAAPIERDADKRVKKAELEKRLEANFRMRSSPVPGR